MALKLLLGNSSPATPGTTGYVSPRVTGTLFTALLTGKATQFRLFSSATSGNFYGAIYDEEQNGNLLWEASSETAIDSSDWAEQDIDSHLDITKDDDYNIAAMADSTNIIRYESVTGAFSWLQVGGLNAYGDGFPDPGTYSSQIKYTGRNWHIQVWGYVPPTVTSVNGGSSIEDGDTSVAVVGTDIVDTDASSADPKAYLSPTSTFSASTAVEQTITGTITDTGFNITVDATGLSTGTVYFFVETGLEQMSDGEAVTLTGGATTNDTALEGSSPASNASIPSTQTLDTALSGTSPSSTANIDIVQNNASVISAFSPSATASIGAVQNNQSVLSGQSPASTASVQSSQTVDASITGYSPASTANVGVTQNNTSALAGYSPASTASIRMLQLNSFRLDGFSPASTAEVTATNTAANEAGLAGYSPASLAIIESLQLNSVSAEGYSPASTASIDALNTAVNNSALAGYSPSSTADIDATQTQETSISGYSPASTATIEASQSNESSIEGESPGSVASISSEQFNDSVLGGYSPGNTAYIVATQDIKNLSSLNAFSPGSLASIIATNIPYGDESFANIILNEKIESIMINETIDAIVINEDGDL